jgi:indolepyruvate ferredoxin oxidoreductase beta subunit
MGATVIVEASARPTPAREPVKILIAALGGQGGGVLTEWIVHAARAEGAVAQATSTPGVSQRTGATTYYLEIARPPEDAAPPVFGLAPVPGEVDVLVCAELLETARMLERGMSTPARTTVVSSTHRVYTTHEKMSGGDARFDSGRIVDAVHALAKHAVLFDMDAISRRHATAISASLFGALAGGGALPVGRAACENAVRGAGKGADASLAAFAEAYERAQAPTPEPSPGVACGRDAVSVVTETTIATDTIVTPDASTPSHALPVDIVRSVAALPPSVAEFAALGAAELIEYQGPRYASRYLDRVARIVIASRRLDGSQPRHEAAREAARWLALWMRYDDVIRVAREKIRASRFARIRDEARAPPGAIVRVYDFFKPSRVEMAAILPRRLGAWLERGGLLRRFAVPGTGAASSSRKGVTLQATSITGALALRAIAALRPLRPHSLRFAREQQAIEDWLVALELGLTHDARWGGDAAVAIARLPRLIRGYGDTHANGRDNFRRILDAYRRTSGTDPKRAADDLRRDAEAALNDPACGQPIALPGVPAARPAAASSRA